MADTNNPKVKPANTKRVFTIPSIKAPAKPGRKKTYLIPPAPSKS